jgi:hypothetical protein
LTVYGRDPSLAGYSVTNPQPAPVITQVTQNMHMRFFKLFEPYRFDKNLGKPIGPSHELKLHAQFLC